MSNIPEELVVEICSWLPVKHLLRFRCISKTWDQRLTSNHQFIKLHLQQSTKSDDPSLLIHHTPCAYTDRCTEFHLFHYDSLRKPLKLEPPFNHSNQTYFVIGICNGLLCLCRLLPRHDPYSTFYIWNPSIKEHISVEYHQPPSAAYRCGYGFGFDQENSVYKIVRIFHGYFYKDSDPTRVHVTTVGENSWRTLPSIPHKIPMCNQVLVRGNPHWIAFSGGRKLILAFDLNDERFQDIEIPIDLSCDTNFDSLQRYQKIGELNGSLCIFHYFCKMEVHIWLMKEYGVVDSWSKEFIIGKPEVRGNFEKLDPICMMKGGQILVQKDLQNVFLYDPRKNSVKRKKSLEFSFDGAYKYTASLVSPKLEEKRSNKGKRHLNGDMSEAETGSDA